MSILHDVYIITIIYLYILHIYKYNVQHTHRSTQILSSLRHLVIDDPVLFVDFL